MFSPLMSYAFIKYLSTGWRTVYYWCIAWEAVAAVAMFFLYHPPSFSTKHEVDGKTKLQLLAEMDYVGLLTFSAACTLLLLGINWVRLVTVFYYRHGIRLTSVQGGVLYPWSSASVIAPIVVAGALFIFLGFWEVFAPLKHPITPPRLFKKFREYDQDLPQAVFKLTTLIASPLSSLSSL